MGGRKNLQRWLKLGKPLDYPAVQRTLERWRPNGGLVYFHLLLDRLAGAGFLPEGTSQPQTTCRNHTDTNRLKEIMTDET